MFATPSALVIFAGALVYFALRDSADQSGDIPAAKAAGGPTKLSVR
jgi:hypothetical protein